MELEAELILFAGTTSTNSPARETIHFQTGPEWNFKRRWNCPKRKALGKASDRRLTTVLFCQ